MKKIYNTFIQNLLCKCKCCYKSLGTQVHYLVSVWHIFYLCLTQYYVKLENVEHCGGESEQAANGFDMGLVTSK